MESETTAADAPQLASESNMPTVAADKELSPTSEQKRHVRFPSDDVVTNYFEPPDLWPRDASVPSSQDLLGRYIDACVRYNTRPLQKLTDQILAVDHMCNRWAPALSLRGERLDPPQVESMEEILRWVRFRIFDISDTMLDDEGATALFDMLEFYDGVENLNISGQKQLTERGWSACARLIRRAASLQALYIRHCSLDSQSLRHIGRALQLGGFLSEIHLERSSIGGAGLAHLVAGARTSSTLKRLHLSSCRLGPSDGTHLGILLRQSRSLEALDVEDNSLQDSGCMQVLSGLAANRDSKLNDIRLGINQLTSQAAGAIAYALVSSPLRAISLTKNNIGTEGVLAMRDGMLRCHLQHLDLSETRLSCEAAIALAEIAVESRTLESLDLRGNPIRTAGMMALGLAARMNQRLIAIEIDRTRPAVAKGGQDSASMVEELLALTIELDRQLALNRQSHITNNTSDVHGHPVDSAVSENGVSIDVDDANEVDQSHSDEIVPSVVKPESDPIQTFFGNGSSLEEIEPPKPNTSPLETSTNEPEKATLEPMEVEQLQNNNDNNNISDENMKLLALELAQASPSVPEEREEAVVDVLDEVTNGDDPLVVDDVSTAGQNDDDDNNSNSNDEKSVISAATETTTSDSAAISVVESTEELVKEVIDSTSPPQAPQTSALSSSLLLGSDDDGIDNDDDDEVPSSNSSG